MARYLNRGQIALVNNQFSSGVCSGVLYVVLDADFENVIRFIVSCPVVMKR